LTRNKKKLRHKLHTKSAAISVGTKVNHPKPVLRSLREAASRAGCETVALSLFDDRHLAKRRFGGYEGTMTSEDVLTLFLLRPNLGTRAFGGEILAVRRLRDCVDDDDG